MNTTLKCIAVDDEPLALDKLTNFVQKVPFLKLMSTFSNGMDAISFLQQNRTDLVFMDIQMEGLTGIQTLEVIQDKPIVILTTAYSEYAVKGFDLNVCDYLLKPFSFDRFYQAVHRAFMLCQSRTSTPKSATRPIENSREFVFIKTEYKIRKVALKDILFIQGMRDYIMLHTTDEKLMTLMSFSDMETLLPSNEFRRVHKSYMIPISRIEDIERNRIVIKGNHIPISNTYRDAFFLFLKQQKTML